MYGEYDGVMRWLKWFIPVNLYIMCDMSSHPKINSHVELVICEIIR